MNSRLYLISKRFCDVVFSVVAGVVLLPLMLLIALMICITNKDFRHNPIFIHKRVGLHGKPFGVMKFRSMKPDAGDFKKYLTPEQLEEFERTFKLTKDPRVTPFGAFLRKSSLDELPQLWNILVGGMTIVGPRPVIESELALFGENAAKLVSVKPGLTGYWQVNGRSATTYDERVRMDMFYIDHRSFAMDLGIFLKTIVIVLNRKGAY